MLMIMPTKNEDSLFKKQLFLSKKKSASVSKQRISSRKNTVYILLYL